MATGNIPRVEVPGYLLIGVYAHSYRTTGTYLHNGIHKHSYIHTYIPMLIYAFMPKDVHATKYMQVLIDINKCILKSVEFDTCIWRSVLNTG